MEDCQNLAFALRMMSPDVSLSAVVRSPKWISTPDKLTPPRVRLGWHIVGWLLLSSAMALCVGSMLWWVVGTPSFVGSGATPLQERFELVKIALAVTGGIGAIVALVVAYRRQHLSEMEEQREKHKLWMERFSTAAGQLGDPGAAVRLAGAYAMASLADDWASGRQMCIDVICAYLRMFYSVDPPSEAEPRTAWHGERQVRQTIIRLISAHLRGDARVSWSGHNLDFTGAVFDDGEFESAVFASGKVSFRDARFIGGRVSLRGIEVSGADVSFQDAQFIDCVVDLTDAAVSAGRISFDGAEFASGEVSFANTSFTGGFVDFGAIFCGSSVSFAGARFLGADVDFTDANFQNGVVDFRTVRVTETALPASIPRDSRVCLLPAQA
jgi:hypothetical protein